MTTPAERVAYIQRAVRSRYAADFESGRLYELGQWNRRKIAGTTIWSQHSWGNAWDIGVRDMTTGDRVVAFLRREDRAGRLPVGTILWRVANHFDHIHVEAIPKQRGLPPLKPTTTTSTEEDEMELTKMIQDVLRSEGYVGADGHELKIDGVPGANTRHALDAMVQDARDSKGLAVRDLEALALRTVEATIEELSRRLQA